MLSPSSNHSLASTASLHRLNSSSRQYSASRLNGQTENLRRSPNRYSLFRTASFSVISGEGRFGGSSSHHSFCPPSSETNTSNELDACWGRVESVQRRTLDSLDTGRHLYEFLKEAQLDHYYSVFSKHLKIRTVQQIKYVTEIELNEMGMSRPEQRLLKKYFEKECPRTAMGKLKKKLSRSTSTRSVSLGRGLTYLGDDQLGEKWASSDSQKIPGYRIIPITELDVTSPLGQGEFGRVHQGSWRPSSGRHMQVAVKILDLDKFPTKTDDFLKEAALMHSLEHPNIVRLYGICVTQKCLKLVTELAPLRSLLDCLREPDLRLAFPVSTLHNFAIQISRGMGYLEEERLVHRDLAARNVLVFSKDKVKIGDFGLSQALQLGKSYYQSNFSANLRLPVAWCAPEAIHDLRFTGASDIWSFGVTLWEVFTYGFTPWAGFSGRQILEAVDIPNCQRLDQPEACPDAVFDAVMRACWNHEPTSRPTFAQLIEMLPRLSPQAWLVVTPCQGSDNKKITDDVRSFLNSSNSHGGVCEDSKSSYDESDKPLLSTRLDEIVYVVSKKDCELWKVVTHLTGRIGYVPPNSLRIAPSSDTVGTHSTMKVTHSLQAGSLSRMRLRFNRKDSANRSGRTSAGPVRLRPDLISLPQNDFRHVGHVGADGTMFGDIGLISTVISDSGQDQSPTNSCLTIESNSDKENPRLSDITLSEQSESPTYNFSPRKSEANKKKSSRHIATPTSPLSSPSENHKSFLDSPVVYSSPSHFSAIEGGGEQSSVFDMGSSFMDEIFKCFSAENSMMPAKTSSQGIQKPLRSKEQTPSIFDEVETPLAPISATSAVQVIRLPSDTNENVFKGPSLEQSPVHFPIITPSTSSSESPNIDGILSRRNFVSNTLTRALRKSSVPRKTTSVHNLDNTSVCSGNSRIPPQKSLKEDRRSSTTSGKPFISGPVIISGPVVMSASSIPLVEPHCLTSSSRSSRGSSLTMISATTNTGSSVSCITPRTQRYSQSSACDVKSITLNHHSDESEEKVDGGISQSSYSTTPSISPAPSLSSIATSASSRGDGGNTGGLVAMATGLRVLGGRDAVFRATGNLPGGTSRRRHANTGQTANMLQPSSFVSSTSVVDQPFSLKPRSSVTDITPHFSLITPSSTAAVYSKSDSLGHCYSPTVSAGGKELASIMTSISPHSASSIESGIGALSSLLSSGPENGIVDETLCSKQSSLRPLPSTINANVDTNDCTSGAPLSDDLLNFWGSEFANFFGA